MTLCSLPPCRCRGTSSAAGVGAAAPVLCWVPPGSARALAPGYLGITRPAGEVGAVQVRREMGTKTREEKPHATGKD